MFQSLPVPLIACLNSSEDVAELLAQVVLLEGWRAVTHVSPTTEGAQPSIDFLTQAQPHACIYAVSPPYAESWQIFQEVREAVPHCAWVVTTTNKRVLDELVGPTETLEIWAKPFDIDDVMASVRRALERA